MHQARIFNAQLFGHNFSRPNFGWRCASSKNYDRMQELLMAKVHHRHPIFARRRFEALPRAEAAQSQRCLNAPQSSFPSGPHHYYRGGSWFECGRAAPMIGLSAPTSHSSNLSLCGLSHIVSVGPPSPHNKYSNTKQSIGGDYRPTTSSCCCCPSELVSGKFPSFNRTQ